MSVNGRNIRHKLAETGHADASIIIHVGTYKFCEIKNEEQWNRQMLNKAQLLLKDNKELVRV